MNATCEVRAILATVAVLLAAAFGVAESATRTSPYWAPGAVDPGSEGKYGNGYQPTTGILWIFDEDFEDLHPGPWTVRDLSGTVAQTNYWHIDDVRVTEPYLGGFTWWCGTDANGCWLQPRGYGNGWYQVLSRHFEEVTGIGGDAVVLEFDQRYAMERDYDFGYVDVSDDGGSSWTTLAIYTNTGTQGAGLPVHWTDPDGHVTLDLSEYAGTSIDLRFRFESDRVFSSADEPSVAPYPVTDGAWQIDNIWITVNGIPAFVDDCESGDTGWTHDDFPGGGQTGIDWWRGRYAIDFLTPGLEACSPYLIGAWMYAAVDPPTYRMVDGEHTTLTSPPIDIAGAGRLVAQWEAWVDLPGTTGDYFDVWVASSNDRSCVEDPSAFRDEDPGCWYGGPFWGTWQDDWTAFAGNDWLSVCWTLFNDHPPEGSVEHGAGVFLNRFMLGVPVLPDTDTAFDRDTWHKFNDWFIDDLALALADEAMIRVSDADGVSSVVLLASDDGGVNWDSYTCVQVTPESDWWRTPPPANQMAETGEIRYYYEATDNYGNAAVFPEYAPNDYFEMSILPITATEEDPGILLVDKHGRFDPGEGRSYLHTTEYYYREALDILGHSYDVYDVEIPSGCALSRGPNPAGRGDRASGRYEGEGQLSLGPPPQGLKYYDTIIYWTNDFDTYTLWEIEQLWLVDWLQDAAIGHERRLLLMGNDISYELIAKGTEVSGFHDVWLAAEYQGEVVEHVYATAPDSVPGLADHIGGYTFMDHDDGACVLAGACPGPVECFDIIGVQDGVSGAEVVADYAYQSCSTTAPAGVAYTKETVGYTYKTILLGFGLEFMMDGICEGGSGNYMPEGYYRTGVADRVNLMGNILGTLTTPGYFGLTPENAPTAVGDGRPVNMLSQARPNPFNPVTRIAYSVKNEGPVAIRVYNLAGRVVRTLLDCKLEAGSEGEVVWDGASDLGRACASGVYFYRINAPGFEDSKRLVLLK